MSKYLVEVTTIDGRKRIIKPSASFEPYAKGKTSVTNAVALMIDSSKNVQGKKQPIILGKLIDLDNIQEEQILLSSNKKINKK